MEKFAPKVMLFTGIMFIAIMAIGFNLNPPTEAPDQKIAGHSNLTAAKAYPKDMSTVETVKSWFGVDIAAERAAKHRATELRKLKQRQKGTKTHYTRTKGVLYNGS